MQLPQKEINLLFAQVLRMLLAKEIKRLTQVMKIDDNKEKPFNTEEVRKLLLFIKALSLES